MEEHISKLKQEGLTGIKWKDLSEEQLYKVKECLTRSPSITVMYVPDNRYLII